MKKNIVLQPVAYAGFYNVEGVDWRPGEGEGSKGMVPPLLRKFSSHEGAQMRNCSTSSSFEQLICTSIITLFVKKITQFL